VLNLAPTVLLIGVAYTFLDLRRFWRRMGAIPLLFETFLLPILPILLLGLIVLGSYFACGGGQRASPWPWHCP
jgi:hypothetical protein